MDTGAAFFVAFIALLCCIRVYLKRHSKRNVAGDPTANAVMPVPSSRTRARTPTRPSPVLRAETRARTRTRTSRANLLWIVSARAPNQTRQDSFVIATLDPPPRYDDPSTTSLSPAPGAETGLEEVIVVENSQVVESTDEPPGYVQYAQDPSTTVHTSTSINNEPPEAIQSLHSRGLQH
ncbi:hypothetical protein BC939DRAFT_461144 [Gamsiella multidivaricata]|uniref:uncharacterized protein n=1 Tax=Gamsiella multidivaricata TaxID=101098 RepID=UPI00221FDEE1|nr:uncharacterized protein BC939DRAFT_461144 [Gamsiella multidivaricata]KAI7819099.1 hypothetical protein BC939DRAFT_461144 [Gamsiella multidivaricata]